MIDPSENDQAPEEQPETAGGEAPEAPEAPEDATDGPETAANAADDAAIPGDDATVSDAIDDARPDDADEPPDHNPEDLAGDAAAANAADDEVLTEGDEVRKYVGFPQYQCHKTVEAFKIAAMEAMSNGNIRLIGAGGVHTVVVDSAYVDKHRPQSGGYYVQYHDGYRSWSPADTFEQGYTLFGE